MRLLVGPTAVEFRAGERLAGCYRYGDGFKPHLHPLNTPAGHTLSLASPHDHKHHKGLMYALRTAEANFWEEIPGGLAGDVVGRQRHERFAAVVESGETVGFEEDLVWQVDGESPSFVERRSLSCRLLADGAGYEWRWATELEARREIELVMSPWSVRRADGTLVNYHGLGIRFCREFGCTGGNALLLDGRATPFAEGMGRSPAEVEYRGSLDGEWPARRAAVRFRQTMGHALFVLDSPFAFMSLGPSNLAARQLRAGERLREHYEIVVGDLPS